MGGSNKRVCGGFSRLRSNWKLKSRGKQEKEEENSDREASQKKAKGN